MSTSYRELLEKLPESERLALAKQLAIPLKEEQLVAYVIGDDIDETSLKVHLSQQLPAFMVPSRIVRVDTFPKTANGKIDRHSLSLPYNLNAGSTLNSSSPESVAREASNRVEIGMAALWAEVLNLDAVGVDENFFELGGNSLIMIKLIGKIQETFAIKLPMTAIGAAPTVRSLVHRIHEDGQEITWPFLVPINDEGTEAPFFMIHGLGGGIFDYYRLKPHLPGDHPFYAIQAPLTPYDDLTKMAQAYLSAVKTVQPEGPYHLGGYCLGAVAAFEIARQLKKQGEDVAMLALIESSPPRRPLTSPGALGTLVTQRFQHFMASDPKAKREFLKNKASNLTKRFKRAINSGREGDHGFAIEAEDYFDLNRYPQAYREIVRVHFRALRDYKPESYSGSATIFRANDDHWTRQDPTLGWADWIEGELETIDIAGDHHTTLHEPHVADLGRKLADTLRSTKQH